MKFGGLSNQEIIKLLNPSERPFALDTEEGKKLLSEIKRHVAIKILKLLYARLRVILHFSLRLKSKKNVRQLHQSFYARMSVETYLENFDKQRKENYLYRVDHRIVCKCLAANMMVCNRYILGNILDSLGPKSICEVGSGSGSTIFYLASRFPSARFTGYELAQAGVDLCKSLQEHGLHGTSYGKTYNLDLASDDLIRKIKFQCSSAYAIDCNDKEFDLVYTFSALEQMAADLPKALAEIRRIARKYVIFHEPFREVNDFYGRAYLWAGDYFRSSVPDIERQGFRAIGFFNNLPIKNTFGYGILVAEVLN
jgi:SAM-dependent methyltransferase